MLEEADILLLYTTLSACGFQKPRSHLHDSMRTAIDIQVILFANESYSYHMGDGRGERQKEDGENWLMKERPGS